MNFFFTLQHWFAQVSSALAVAAWECYKSFLPIDWLGDALNAASNFLANVAAEFRNLGFWYDALMAWVGTVVRQIDFDAFIRIVTTDLADLWALVLGGIGTIGDAISLWWDTQVAVVQGWIDAAIVPFTTIITTIQQGLANLDSWWASFTQSVLPTLVNVFDVDMMIKSALGPFADAINIITQFAESIVDFFGDPFQWLYDRLDEFFERFW